MNALRHYMFVKNSDDLLAYKVPFLHKRTEDSGVTVSTSTLNSMLLRRCTNHNAKQGPFDVVEL